MKGLIFYAGYGLITIIWGALSIPVAWPMSQRNRFALIVGGWTRAQLGWLRWMYDIRTVVHGREHIPGKPCVVFAHHESSWEALFLQTLFAPQATLIKRELLWIPFFGWAYAMTRPIAIDRASPRAALKTLIKTGRQRLQEGIWVLLFPEGTRMPPGKIGRFQPGGAALACASGAPVLVVAHNAGRCWPAHRLRKHAGRIDVHISAPVMAAGCSPKEVNEAAYDTMMRLQAKITRPD